MATVCHSYVGTWLQFKLWCWIRCLCHCNTAVESRNICKFK